MSYQATATDLGYSAAAVDSPYLQPLPEVASDYLTTTNYQTQLLAAAALNGHDATASAYNAFINYIFFDPAAYNLASGTALNNALTAGNTLALADLATYAAAYTP